MRTWQLGSLLLVLACSDTTAAGDGSYTAALSGSSEVPPNTSGSSGSATVTVHGSTLTYRVDANALSTPITAGHLYLGGTKVNGVVILGLDIEAQQGRVAEGTLDISGFVTFNTSSIRGDSLRTLLSSGQAYVNIHTQAYPGGEIRGQLTR